MVLNTMCCNPRLKVKHLIMLKLLHDVSRPHYTMHPTRSEFNKISKESSLIPKLTVLGCRAVARHISEASVSMEH